MEIRSWEKGDATRISEGRDEELICLVERAKRVTVHDACLGKDYGCRELWRNEGITDNGTVVNGKMFTLDGCELCRLIVFYCKSSWDCWQSIFRFNNSRFRIRVCWAWVSVGTGENSSGRNAQSVADRCFAGHNYPSIS